MRLYRYNERLLCDPLSILLIKFVCAFFGRYLTYRYQSLLKVTSTVTLLKSVLCVLQFPLYLPLKCLGMSLNALVTVIVTCSTCALS